MSTTDFAKHSVIVNESNKLVYVYSELYNSTSLILITTVRYEYQHTSSQLLPIEDAREHWNASTQLGANRTPCTYNDEGKIALTLKTGNPIRIGLKPPSIEMLNSSTPSWALKYGYETLR